MTTTTRTERPSPMAGWICRVGAVIGLVQGPYLLVVSPAVGEDPYSYSYTPTGFAIAQLSSRSST